MLSICPRTEILIPFGTSGSEAMALSMSRATEPRSRMPAAAWTLITRWMVEWFTEAMRLAGRELGDGAEVEAPRRALRSR